MIRQILIKEYNIFIVLCSSLLCPKMLQYFFFFATFMLTVSHDVTLFQ